MLYRFSLFLLTSLTMFVMITRVFYVINVSLPQQINGPINLFHQDIRIQTLHECVPLCCIKQAPPYRTFCLFIVKIFLHESPFKWVNNSKTRYT